MVFKSDKQRKAFFGSRGNPRSFTTPRMKAMPKLPQDVRNFISDEISRQRKEGRPQDQSVAIAFSKARMRFPKSRKRLELIDKMSRNPNGNSQKRIRRLILLVFGVAVALQILRRLRG